MGGMAQGSKMVTILLDDSDTGGLQTTLSGALPYNKGGTVLFVSLVLKLGVMENGVNQWFSNFSNH